MKFTNPLPNTGLPKWSTTEDSFQARWRNGLQLKITEANTNSVVRGLNVKWTAPVGEAVTQCVDLGTVNWFGGSELYSQAWPIQTQSFPETAFVPNSQTGGVIERYFLSSGGFALYVPHTVPLFVSLNTGDNTLCFKASYDDPYRNTDGRPTELDHFVFNVDPPGLILNHLTVLYTYLGTPPAIPSTKLIASPIWSTWAQYHTDINQDTVLAFAQEIYDHGFPASQIEIDDKWEDCYGNEVFDSTKFPDPASMVAAIKALGYDVTVWVHPFVNSDCALYAEGDSNKFLVPANGYDVTGTVSWWEGQGGIIDITKPAASDWWFQRLDKLRTEVGITSFKFDAGETEFLPQNAYLNSSENLQPGIYSTAYANFVSQFGDQLELRVGYGSQNVPNFVRILDRDSRWGLDNGLHSVLTSTLHFGIVGYPFVLPDYIGGNAYGVEYPDRELYIRWVELNAFLPVMQFSIPPWVYDDEVVQITKKYVDLRTTLADSLINGANLAVADGYPIIRPLWWVDTTDVTAQSINDEFMVADSFLVAPIVEKGAVTRDIYFPVGDWVDQDSQVMYSGPGWVRNFSVPLDEIAYFRMATC